MANPSEPPRTSPDLGELATLPGGLPGTTESAGSSGPADPRCLSNIEAALERARVQALLGLEVPPPHLGRFLVKSVLGRGGMGVVLAAHDPQLDRRVAVKLLDDTDATAGAREAVLREARSLARLSHPNVVGVYEVGDVDGMPYIAMELVEGTTLRGWLEGQGEGQNEGEDEQVPSRLDVLRMFLAVGEGLGAAHEAGIVHRDFKPDNVLVGEDGRPRILDFGLSRALPKHDASDEAPSTIPREAPGLTAGTPAYMAPEQWLGEPSDERTDVFAFCVALFEALYGERPFAGDTMLELMEEVTSGSPRQIPGPERVAAPLHEAILRGLAREPPQRWSSMRELVAVIRETLARAQPGMLAGSPGVIVRVIGPLNLLFPVGWLLAELAGWVEYRPSRWIYVSGAQVLLLGLLVRVGRSSFRSVLRTPQVLDVPLVFIPLLIGHRIVTLALDSPVEAMFAFDYMLVAGVSWAIVLFVERGMWPMIVAGLGLSTLAMVRPAWAPRLWVAFVALTPFIVAFAAKRAIRRRNRAILGDSTRSRRSRANRAQSRERTSDFL